MNKDDGALIFGHEQTLPAVDMCNIYLEEGSKYVNSVPEKQKETSGEKTMLCLIYSYLFLKKKKTQLH